MKCQNRRTPARTAGVLPGPICLPSRIPATRHRVHQTPTTPLPAICPTSSLQTPEARARDRVNQVRQARRPAGYARPDSFETAAHAQASWRTATRTPAVGSWPGPASRTGAGSAPIRPGRFPGVQQVRVRVIPRAEQTPKWGPRVNCGVQRSCGSPRTWLSWTFHAALVTAGSRLYRVKFHRSRLPLSYVLTRLHRLPSDAPGRGCGLSGTRLMNERNGKGLA